jgi:hypothetical protein
VLVACPIARVPHLLRLPPLSTATHDNKLALDVRYEIKEDSEAAIPSQVIIPTPLYNFVYWDWIWTA